MGVAGPALLILKIYTTFKDIQMMLKHFLDISTGFRYKKKIKKSSPSIYRDVHELARLKHHKCTHFITCLQSSSIVLFTSTPRPTILFCCPQAIHENFRTPRISSL